MSDSVELIPAVILAGGLATRLRPLTTSIPKALIEIEGHPFLWHQLRLLKRNGIRRVVMLVGYLGEQIQERFGDGSLYGMSIDYSFDGPALLGTGGAIRKALPLLPRRFFVLYGDSYLPCDYRAVEGAFQSSEKSALMTVYRNDNLYDSSNVEYDGTRILRYDKRNRTPEMHYIDYGLGAFDRGVFEAHPVEQPLDLATVYQDLLAAGDLAAFEVHDRFYEIGTPDGLWDAAAFIKRNERLSGRAAVFLDRDGVLNDAVIRDGKPHPPDVEDFEISREAPQALNRLKEQGFFLVVVTNQPDVARGNQTREAVQEMERRLRAGLPLDDVLTCFHDDADACDCRKPRPGMIMQAAKRYSIDLSRSYMTGDRWRDIDAGANAGCHTVWIDRGYNERLPASAPDARVASLTEAVDWILKNTAESF